MNRLLSLVIASLCSFSLFAKTLPVLTTSYWRETFFDDFRGKPDDSARSTYCYDQIKPQCHVWTGGSSHDCELSTSYPPMRENMAAAVNTLDPGPWASQPFAAVQTRYAQLIADNVRNLDKCTWTLFEQLNFWATDYKHHYTSRFDGTQVKVDPSGKGRLLLSAVAAPLQADCVYGGQEAGPNCLVYGFAANEVKPGVHYWADPDPRWPGVYYTPINGTCPHGGSVGVNCQLRAFPPALLEEKNVEYWVDTNPAWPGVYYANNTPYRCTFNIDYFSTGVNFRNLTCPILNGAVMSSQFVNLPYVDPFTGEIKVRGQIQHQGRFEVKAKVPKASGAFPAAWLMPQTGGWPYMGGEIDVMEARDAANEVYQTYHHGKCFTTNPLTEHFVEGKGDCEKIAGATSVQLSKGRTVKEAKKDEFWTRDHVFAVEWNGPRLDYYVNNVHTSTVQVGTQSEASPTIYPPLMTQFATTNFPTAPFFWILNHSAYAKLPERPVKNGIFDFGYPARLAAWLVQVASPNARINAFKPQTYSIDWVRNYTACKTDADFCPCGGEFEEGVGCVLPSGQMACPPEVPTPVLNGDVYQSSCRPARQDCIHGGDVAGPNCQIKGFENPEIVPGVKYWVDTDPRWPGVYYALINGKCPFGGLVGANCQVRAFSVPSVYVVMGVQYWVDTNPAWPGVYYKPINGKCPYGGGQGVNCQLIAFPPGTVSPSVFYWVDTNPRWPGVYYAQQGGNCFAGGQKAGPNCQVHGFQNPEVVWGVNYWVDPDPRWPGVYYAPVAGHCPFGGGQGVNCQVTGFKSPSSYVVAGVKYWVDSNPNWPGVYYAPINGGCPYGGSQGVNCQLVALAPDVLESGVTYWVDTDPRWPGVYYAPDFR